MSVFDLQTVALSREVGQAAGAGAGGMGDLGLPKAFAREIARQQNLQG